MADRLGKRCLGWLVGMFLVAPIMAWAGQDAIAPKDQQFLMTAAGAQKAELALGQMAIQRAENEKVKQLAHRMVEDHIKAGQEVRKLAEAAGITLPDDPSVDPQKLGDTRSKLSGTEFDRAYVQHEVKNHQKNLAEFKKTNEEAQTSADQTVGVRYAASAQRASHRRQKRVSVSQKRITQTHKIVRSLTPTFTSLLRGYKHGGSGPSAAGLDPHAA